MEVLKINVPSLFITKLYLYTFLNLLQDCSLKEVEKYIIVEGKDISYDFAERLRDVAEFKKNENIPMSGNDRNIFEKVKNEIGCPQVSPKDLLETYANMVESKGLQRLKDGLKSFSTSKGYAMPSIFKLELYKLVRAPLLKDGTSINIKLSLDYFIVLLAGYLMSRVGRAPYKDINDQLSIHILPLSLGWRSDIWYMFIQNNAQKLLPGFDPQEALILWLIQANWEIINREIRDIFVVGVKDPKGANPASIGIGFQAPLENIIQNYSQSLEVIMENKRGKKALESLLRYALRPPDRRNLKNRELALKLTKKLFLAIEGDIKSLEDLMLLSSRVEQSLSRYERNESEELKNIAKYGRILASLLLKQFYSY